MHVCAAPFFDELEFIFEIYVLIKHTVINTVTISSK